MNLSNRLVVVLKRDKLHVFIFRVIRYLLGWYVDTVNNVKYRMLRVYSISGVIKTVLGSKMLLDFSDSGLSKDLVLNGIREKHATEMLPEFIKDGDVVFDIGANIGYYALYEAILVGDSGKVYAFEPVVNNFNKLKSNLNLNLISNMELYNLAMGDDPGTRSIYLADKGNWCSLKLSDHIRVDGKVITQDTDVSTLDNFVLEHGVFPDMIRMDVEGYEYEILHGFSDFISSDNPLKIFMEFHVDALGDNANELLDILNENGFVFRGGASRELRYRSKILSFLFDWLSNKIQPYGAGIIPSMSIEELKTVLSYGELYPQLMFERKGCTHGD